MSINERLRKILEVRDLSIKQLSDQTGLPYRTLQNYLHAIRPPSAEALRLICTCTGIDANWVLLGEGPMERGYVAAPGRPSMARDGDQDEYLVGEARRLSRRALAEQELGQARIAATQAAQPRMWKLVRLLHDRHPETVPVAELTRWLQEHEGLSADEVTAALALLVSAGLVAGHGDASRRAYGLKEGLGSVEFRDTHEVLAFVVSAVEELTTTLLPAVRQRRGKLVTAKVRARRGEGRRVAEELRTLVKDHLERLPDAPEGEEILTLLLGLAVEPGAAVPSASDPDEGSRERR